VFSIKKLTPIKWRQQHVLNQVLISCSRLNLLYHVFGHVAGILAVIIEYPDRLLHLRVRQLRDGTGRFGDEIGLGGFLKIYAGIQRLAQGFANRT
jgi:hypothetical protein